MGRLCEAEGALYLRFGCFSLIFLGITYHLLGGPMAWLSRRRRRELLLALGILLGFTVLMILIGILAG